MYENIAVADINTAVNGIELSFANRPPYEVLKDLKENGFRWHNKKQIWYGRNTAANVRAVEKYVDIDASDVSFGVTPDGMVDVRGLRNKRLGISDDALGRDVGADAQYYKYFYVGEQDREAEAFAVSRGWKKIFGSDAQGLNGDTWIVYREASDLPKFLQSYAEAQEMADGRSTSQYELGFGHLGNGITVWNSANEVHGDYQTVAHISADREITFYDKNMPESVVQQIRDFAEKETPPMSATQHSPVFNTVSDVRDKEKKPVRDACIADFYDAVGGVGIYPDSTVEGSLWSSVGSMGYYKDINAYIWCNYNSAIVIELDNAMKRGKECKRYSVYSNDVDSFAYITNELKINSPKELYDFVRSGKEAPGNGKLYVSELKGVEVFSPFVAVKPLEKMPEKWKKGDLVKALMCGQAFSATLDQRLTDDYAYDAACNFCSGRRLDLPGQAADLVEGCRDCYISLNGIDENGFASVHYSYGGEMKTFLVDLKCDLAESIERQAQALRDIEAHNKEVRSKVKAIAPDEVDTSKVYLVSRVVEDDNTGKLSVTDELVQGWQLKDCLDFYEITGVHEAEFVHNKLYEVANFYNRREYAEEDARIINTGNWGQVCSGKAVEELTREGVSLHLAMSSYDNPITFEDAKRDCMNFISGKTFFMFGEKVDYSNSLKKLEAEEVRVARDKTAKRELSSLSDIIGFAEVKREFEKNQRANRNLDKDRDNSFDR